ncbi:helix-turn-helix transcriptional regulator [Sphingobium sufflavum]|uniref:AraC family transcriptional regulator n=1 Tax=Sphingobium sufflavum TaxID=1129547 RepID=UPI001F410CCF|nr:AraC family transcriptional regulator [Sphingobium sufflavum]MCE7798079.1 helix-turn-helix transcriptional regulator [Sphingobium sufflavum]
MNTFDRTLAAMSPMLQLERERIHPMAELMVIRLDHKDSDEHLFCKEGLFWIDLCLTPRRVHDRASYTDRWGPHRTEAMGSIMALPPGFRLQLRSGGGEHMSLICALKEEAVRRWLPADFQWTDRRLESCLNISNTHISALLLRLSQEIRHEGVGSEQVVDALILQLSVELARYLIAIDEPDDRGGLAAWRMRVLEQRIAEPGPLPTLIELATLCSISTRQLSRAFRTSRGCTVADYVVRCRIEAAKRRLATDESIKSIAIVTGFSSQSAFTFAFRRATGVTPHEFRSRMLRGITYSAA